MNAKTFFVPALSLSALAAVLLTPQPSNGQAAGGAEDAALAALVGEVAVQQAAILENQAKIDAKLANISEILRVARLFVARGGGRSK